MSPFFLIFGGEEDKTLAERINNLLDKKIEIIREENPYYIKGIIENSFALIGSRFHSIACGLYSSIPTLGTGWSHKYLHIFKDFNSENCLISFDDMNSKAIDLKLEWILDSSKRTELKDKLEINKTKYVKKSLELFDKIRKLLGLNK